MKRPEDYQKYYQIVKEYTSLVIASGTHSVGTSYQDIFTKESNFEIKIGRASCRERVFGFV